MAVERLQCPSCGGNITAEGRDSLFCSFCGAKLRVKTGASGNPMAVLDGIKEDTSLMARRSALGHVEEELSRLGAERERAVQSYRAKKGEIENERGKGCVAFLPVVLLLSGFALAAQFLYGKIAQGVVGLVLVGAAIALYVAWAREDAAGEREKAALKASASETVNEIDAKVAALRERAQALKGELDRSISEI